MWIWDSLRNVDNFIDHNLFPQTCRVSQWTHTAVIDNFSDYTFACNSFTIWINDLFLMLPATQCRFWTDNCN